jgi:hypothetical protein
MNQDTQQFDRPAILPPPPEEFGAETALSPEAAALNKLKEVSDAELDALIDSAVKTMESAPPAEVDSSLEENAKQMRAVLDDAQHQAEMVMSSTPDELMATTGESLIKTGKQMVEGAKVPEESLQEFQEKEAPRLIEQSNQLSEALGRAILAAHPERLKIEQERSATEEGLRGAIVAIGEIGGFAKNSPLRTRLENGQMAVYKPRSRETAIRKGIEVGSYAAREWLAFQIDKALQLDIVPATVLRNGTEGLGAVQEWKNDTATAAAAVEGWQGAANVKQLERVGFFDSIVTNTDRHLGNFLIAKGGKVHAIDHGLILSKQPERHPDDLNSAPAYALEDKIIAPELLGLITDFKQSPEIQTALKAAFELALGQDSAAAWENFMKNMEYVLISKKLLPLGQNWHNMYQQIEEAQRQAEEAR